MNVGANTGNLYQTNKIVCCLLVVYFSQVYRDSFWSSIRFKSVRQTRFDCPFQSSLLDKIDYNRRLNYILIKSVRQTLFTSLFQSSLHPCFAHEFYSSLSIETCFTSLYISRVYSIQRGRYTCFACLFFNPTYFLCESILVEYITGNRQPGNQEETK